MALLSTLTMKPTILLRAKTAVGAGLALLRDPGRLDQALVLTQAVNAGMAANSVVRIEATGEGKRLLEERPRIDRAHVDFEALRRLPDGTLGREYVRFLDDNGIGPEPFETLPDIGDPRAAWLVLRMRQTHDLWHVLTGYRPDVEGEVLLQAFTYAQVRAPSALLIVVFGSLRLLSRGLGYLRALRHAFARGRATRFLATFRWEEHWDRPLAVLREELACPV
jgi:ubiquinone biosynthesis protein COQ4